VAFTTAQLEALEAAIASGELTVKYNGKEVTYRSVTDLVSARNIVLTNLQGAGALPRIKRTSYATRVRN
jgi:hypothetical protein